MMSRHAPSGMQTNYSRFAFQGPYDVPRAPTVVEPVKGLRIVATVPIGKPDPRIVVFSHGELLSPEVYFRLLSHWASHGFAVLAPLHDDSVFKDGLDAGGVDRATGAATWDVARLLDAPGAWGRRCRTCSDVMDQAESIGRIANYRFSPNRAIVVGHSYGAMTASLLTGVVSHDRNGREISGRDPRFSASIAMSPNGIGFMGLSADSWEGVDRPTMHVTGIGDYDTTKQSPETKAEGFSLEPPGNKHLVWMSKVWPTLYTGARIDDDTPAADVFRDLLATSTAFLRAYSEREEDTLALLTEGYFERTSEGRMRISYR